MRNCLDNVYVLDKTYQKIGVIDFASSIIWSNRYFDAGDFEVYARCTKKAVDLLQEGYYLIRDDCDMVGIIENISITTDAENGNWITAAGRDAKSLLARRIVWNQTTLNGNVASKIITLLNENIISPSIANRAINNFIAVNPSATEFTERFDKQITGENLYEAILGICKEFSYGFKVTLANGIFKFELYKGANRSVKQTVNSHVVFSPEYDNFLGSEYNRATEDYRNVALVAGEGEGSARITQAVGTASGLDRHEIYIDSRNTSSNEGEITESEYANLLIAEGQEALAGTVKTKSFSGEIDNTRTYTYKTDYFLGDIVTVRNEFGMQENVRITEVLECLDDNGLTITPIFEDEVI